MNDLDTVNSFSDDINMVEVPAKNKRTPKMDVRPMPQSSNSSKTCTLVAQNTPNYCKDMNSILCSANEVIKRVEEGVVGLKSGFNQIDNMLGGFENRELTLIAGLPGGGKSSLLLQFALNFIRQNKRVLLLSYEVFQDEVGINILSNITRINSMIFKTKKLKDEDKKKIKKAEEELAKLPLFVIDANIPLEKTLPIIEIIKPDVLMVDYIDIMPEMQQSDSSQESLGYIMRKLLEITKHYNIPVIAVTAMNREASKRNIVNFKLSDLKGSGSKEYDAHRVFFIWSDEDGMHIDVKKNRNGPSGINMDFKFTKQYHLIEDKK